MRTHREDPTIRPKVVAVASRLLASDPKTPLSQIALEAGVSRATFYRHFGSRTGLLAALDRVPPPDARARIVSAAADQLVGTSLAGLSMDDLATVASVSRGTLYRIFPGKAALFRAVIEAYSPFESVVSLLAARRNEPPSIVLPLIARAIVRAAESHLGVIRAVFDEATNGSAEVRAAARPVLFPALGALAEYFNAQMLAGRMRKVHPLIAIQAFVGPIYFHLMTRSLAEDLFSLPVSLGDAINDLVSVSQAGMATALGDSEGAGRLP